MRARLAAAADAEEVVRTLAEAFFADPVWGWAFDDDQHRVAQHSAWFRVVVDRGIENRSVWMTPGHEAVAVWVPPGRDELTPADEEAIESAFAATLGERAGLVIEVFSRFELAHPHESEHYYLSLLATRPAHRGSGHGMRLLAENLAQVDAVGGAAYLESTNPANVKRYESVGFEVSGSFGLPAGGPSVTTMWRPAR